MDTLAFLVLLYRGRYLKASASQASSPHFLEDVTSDSGHRHRCAQLARQRYRGPQAFGLSRRRLVAFVEGGQTLRGNAGRRFIPEHRALARAPPRTLRATNADALVERQQPSLGGLGRRTRRPPAARLEPSTKQRPTQRRRRKRPQRSEQPVEALARPGALTASNHLLVALDSCVSRLG